MENRKYLVDTNIFLEILLEQSKAEDCKKFLSEHFNEIMITDFCIHSIGIICYRKKLFEVYEKFIADIVQYTPIITLTKFELHLMAQHSKDSLLDYDDSYQLEASTFNHLEIATMDKDFYRVAANHKIHFI